METLRRRGRPGRLARTRGVGQVQGWQRLLGSRSGAALAPQVAEELVLCLVATARTEDQPECSTRSADSAPRHAQSSAAPSSLYAPPHPRFTH